jgi:hypothetical protein
MSANYSQGLRNEIEFNGLDYACLYPITNPTDSTNYVLDCKYIISVKAEYKFYKIRKTHDYNKNWLSVRRIIYTGLQTYNCIIDTSIIDEAYLYDDTRLNYVLK